MKYYIDDIGTDSKSKLSDALKGSSFSTRTEYLTLMNKLASIAKKSKINKTSPIYSREISPIKNGKPLTEKTNWGGVALKNVDVENDFVRKLLVVGKYGRLGFEYHNVKHEHLTVLEGMCIVLYSNHKRSGWKKGGVTAKVASKGDKFDFLPGDEHGILALTNCVIEERSTNHLDDLVFVFNAN
jgi:mannose-6-phosphate isomerase-like protein (cupin superfamily)